MARGGLERIGHGLEQDEALTPAQAADEYLLMGLRLTEGIELKRLQGIAGRKRDPSRIAGLAAEGLLTQDGDRLAATPQGRLVLDRLIVELAA